MDKPYRIEFENRGDYLYVLVGGGKLTAEISAAYWREIAHECFELKIDKILIEKDFPETVSPPEMVQMGEYLGYLLPTFRVAFIDRHRHQSINELGKKIARNREVVMQLFNEVGEAEQWLRAN